VTLVGKIEELRSLLYKAINSNKREEILEISRELDKVIVKEMIVIYDNKDSLNIKNYS
jgi:hypothetical protein